MVCSCCQRIPRGLKICFAITAILLLAIVAVALTLYFTMLKPKNPQIATKSITLESYSLVYWPVIHVNITLGIIATVNNRNYGSFKYGNSSVFVTYRETQVAEGVILEGTIPSRAMHDVQTSITLIGDVLAKSPHFLGDYNSGIMNFTSSTLLKGKATVMKILKVKVTTFTTCDITVFLRTQNASAFCSSKLKY